MRGDDRYDEPVPAEDARQALVIVGVFFAVLVGVAVALAWWLA